MAMAMQAGANVALRGVVPLGAMAGIQRAVGGFAAENSGTSRVTGIAISLPGVTGIAVPLTASVLTGDYGGTRGTLGMGLWYTNGIHCPVTVWEDADKSGVGWVWDDNIRPSGLQFFVDVANGTAQVSLNFGVSIDPGQSVNVGVQLFAGAGIVHQVLAAYRDQVQRTLARNGVARGLPFSAYGLWLYSGWQNEISKFADSLPPSVLRLMMWSPPDGQGWFEYLQPRLAWWPKKKATTAIPVGGLVSPSGSPRIDQSQTHWELDRKYVPNRALPLAVQDPDVLAYGDSVRKAFLAAGMDLAYWDIGQPSGGTIYDLLHIHQRWRDGGVPLMSEAYSPLTSAIAGIALRIYYTGYTWDRKHWTREIHNAVCPGVPFVAGINAAKSDAQSVRRFEANGVTAWEDLVSSGCVAMVPDWFFLNWLAQHGG